MVGEGFSREGGFGPSKFKGQLMGKDKTRTIKRTVLRAEGETFLPRILAAEGQDYMV